VSKTPAVPPAQPIEPRRRGSWKLRAVGIGAIAVVGWLLIGPALHVAQAAVALVGYVLVAVGAYFVGKWVGRHSAPR